MSILVGITAVVMMGAGVFIVLYGVREWSYEENGPSDDARARNFVIIGTWLAVVGGFLGLIFNGG